jgi:hypothetical protein
LGQLIEDITGQGLPEYMIDHVFEPLGMVHSDYTASQRVTERMASGYQLRFGRMRRVRELSIALLGAGAVQSSLRDLTSYAVALLNDGANESGSVLSPDSLEEMLRPRYRPDERLPATGLAFFLDEIDGHRVAGHDGNNPGFNSSVGLRSRRWPSRHRLDQHRLSTGCAAVIPMRATRPRCEALPADVAARKLDKRRAPWTRRQGILGLALLTPADGSRLTGPDAFQ